MLHHGNLQQELSNLRMSALTACRGLNVPDTDFALIHMSHPSGCSPSRRLSSHHHQTILLCAAWDAADAWWSTESACTVTREDAPFTMQLQQFAGLQKNHDQHTFEGSRELKVCKITKSAKLASLDSLIEGCISRMLAVKQQKIGVPPPHA